MLGKLLKKEIALTMHPIVPFVLLMSVMVFIPNYPYTVVFFYTTLSIFFTCLLGRENNDVIYSLNLPIAKSDLVKGRFAFSILLEMIQMALVMALCLLKQNLHMTANEAGLEANIVLVGFGLLLYGIFNLVFFLNYYKNVSKVGFSFVIASILFFIGVIAEAVLTHAVPFIRDHLDTNDPEYMSEKMIVLITGIILYIVLTAIAYNRSKKLFEVQDL
ncbi:MAG: hypothetical protein E7256_05895 [Lachnospiraceae bacterium]|nr:hypothetical protein [Lachnospiraceae bacterium]